MTNQEINNRRCGKSYKIFCKFVAQARKEKLAVLHSKDYVVMSKSLFKLLFEGKDNKKIPMPNIYEIKE